MKEEEAEQEEEEKKEEKEEEEAEEEIQPLRKRIRYQDESTEGGRAAIRGRAAKKDAIHTMYL